jgi:hypothetical protein
MTSSFTSPPACFYLSFWERSRVIERVRESAQSRRVSRRGAEDAEKVKCRFKMNQARDIGQSNERRIDMIKNDVFPPLSATPAPLREPSVCGLFSTQSVVARPIAALFALFTIVGCADPTVGTVSGTITVDGAPAKSGSIAFFPVDGKSSTSGAEIVDGQYTATVAPGTARVEIHVPKVIGQRKAYDTPDSPMMEIVGESLPAKYNEASELTLDVRPGENRQDYNLTAK